MIDKEKIIQETKRIINKFMEALEEAEGLKDKFGEERNIMVRENIVSEESHGFRDRLFKNAPKKNKDYIIAEKKHW